MHVQLVLGYVDTDEDVSSHVAFLANLGSAQDRPKRLYGLNNQTGGAHAPPRSHRSIPRAGRTPAFARTRHCHIPAPTTYKGRLASLRAIATNP